MFKLLSLCLILCGVVVAGVRITGNELLVFTNIQETKLKITLNDKEKEKEIENVSNKYSISSFNVYSLILASEGENTISFKVINEDKDLLLSINLSFKKDVEDNNVLDTPIKDEFVAEANFTHWKTRNGDKVVFVISDCLDNKIQLDKNLEIAQYKYIFSTDISCVSFLEDLYTNLKTKYEIGSISKDVENWLNRLTYELTFNVAYLYMLVSSYDSLYLSTFTKQDSIAEFLCLCLIKSFICKKIEELNNVDNFFDKYEKIVDEIEESFKEILNEVKGIFDPFVEDLQLKWQFFIKKDKFDAKYIVDRENEYLNPDVDGKIIINSKAGPIFHIM